MIANEFNLDLNNIHILSIKKNHVVKKLISLKYSDHFGMRFLLNNSN